MAVINLTEKYSSQIQQKFTAGSFLDGRFSNDLDFVGAKTVRVYSIGTVPVNDYSRTASANRYGTPQEVGDTVQEFTMTQDKSFTGIIDKGNTKDQTISKAGKFLNVEISEVITPMMDAYKMDVICNGTHKHMSDAGVVTDVANPGTDFKGAAISASNVINRLGKARKAFLDGRVPTTGRTLFVTTEVFNALVDTDQFKAMSQIGEKAIVKGQVGEIFGTPVVELPADIMPTGVHFVMVHKDAVATASKIAETKVHIDPPGISGNLVEGRYYYDTFVFDKKNVGIYVDRLTSS